MKFGKIKKYNKDLDAITRIDTMLEKDVKELQNKIIKNIKRFILFFPFFYEAFGFRKQLLYQFCN